MPKKKGLGEDVNSSIEIMDELLSSLKAFEGMHLKRGLDSNGLLEEKLEGKIDEVQKLAHSLQLPIRNLREKIKDIKPISNVRFAPNAKVGSVVSKFLEMA
jgi:hypothetical protein